MRKAFPLLIAAVLVFGATTPYASEYGARPLRPGHWEGDDFSWVRGANYIPSYASNTIEQWAEYEPETIERELALAEKLDLNSLRVWLQYFVYETDQETFLRNYEDFLARCAVHGIRPMLVLFDGCFGADPEAGAKHWVACPGPSRMTEEHWPRLRQYLDDVVGKHVGDPRILFWDVMNEPSSLGVPEVAKGDVAFGYDFARTFTAYVNEIDDTHPTTIGVGHHSHIAEVVDDVDVVTYHNYQPFQRAFELEIDAARELAEGKAVLITETTPCYGGQDPHMSLRTFREKEIGWYLWHFVFGELDLTIASIVTSDGRTPWPDYAAAVLGLTVPEDCVPERYTGKTIRDICASVASEPTTESTFARRKEAFGDLGRSLGWAGVLEDVAGDVLARAGKMEELLKAGDKCEAYKLLDENIVILHAVAKDNGFYNEYE